MLAMLAHQNIFFCSLCTRFGNFMHSNVWGFSAELIESAMYLYRATRDPTLLELGRDAVESIEKISKVDCGFATVSAKSMVTSAKWLLKVRF